MGVIQRQGIKSSVVSYVGIVIGAISTLFIYPLEWDIYGSLQYWIATATLLVPILRLGSTSLINKYYPYFKKNSISGFFKLIIVVTFSTIAVMTVLLFGIRFIVLHFNLLESVEFFRKSFYIVYAISVLMITATILQQQSSNYGRIVIPDLLTGFSLKLILPLLVLLGFSGVLNQPGIAISLIFYYLVSILLLFFYTKSLNAFDINGNPFKTIGSTMKKAMSRYWLFGGLNYLGTILAYKIDVVMIGSILTKALVGYYSTFLFLSAILEIPFRAINRISAPVISQAFEKKEIFVIEDIYKKASKNLLITGVFMFSIIWLNMDNIFDIMTNGDDIRKYKMIFLCLGFSKLFDMVTSVNNLILIYSKWYKYNLIFLLILGTSNIVLNIFLIDAYGIEGAAYATAVSILGFNIVKSLFVYIKLGIHPFTSKLYWLILIFIGVLFAEYFVNLNLGPIFSGLIITGIFSTAFLAIIWFTNISEEMNQLLIRVFKKFRL